MRYLFYITLLFPFISAWAANIYTQEKNNILLPADQTEFVIKLKSNPTTGYMWQLQSYDKNAIVPTKHSFEPSGNKNLMGAPGYEYFSFRATKEFFMLPQQTDLKFIYARPWVNNDQTTSVIFHISNIGH